MVDNLQFRARVGGHISVGSLHADALTKWVSSAPIFRARLKCMVPMR